MDNLDLVHTPLLIMMIKAVLCLLQDVFISCCSHSFQLHEESFIILLFSVIQKNCLGMFLDNVFSDPDLDIFKVLCGNVYY